MMDYGRFVVCTKDPRYEVSDMGYVKSKARGIPTRGHENKKGYCTVKLGKGGKDYMVHNLVTEAFIGPKPEGMQVDHINGQRNDNRLENLRYLSPKDNNNTDLHLDAIGRKIYCFTTSFEFVRSYRSASDAARDNGVKYQQISKSANGTDRHKSSCGYLWMYADVFHQRFIYLW